MNAPVARGTRANFENLKTNGRCPNDLQQKQRAGVLAGSTGNTPKDEAVAATPTLLDFRWSHVHVQKTQRADATSSSAILKMQDATTTKIYKTRICRD